MNPKILVIEDDTDLCLLLEKYLSQEHYDVTICNDGMNGLTTAVREDFSLVILDLMLPELNGFEVLTSLRKEKNIPVVILTAKGSEIDTVLGLRLGADDYLAKPFRMNELIARIDSQIRRNTRFNQAPEKQKESLIFATLSIDPMAYHVISYGKQIELTVKEFELLYFLARHENQVFTKKQIYRNVWNENYAYDDNNVMVHIRRLRKKIEKDSSNPKYIQTVWGLGYKFISEEEK